jgi:mRNA-degrading endonuclease RelE of RelBE toxin-antitoxin system
VSEQVRAYQRILAPEIRRAMKAAILALPGGDTKPLSDELDGLHRLRVGHHRVIFRHRAGQIECFLAAPRSLVYEYLAAHLHEYLG